MRLGWRGFLARAYWLRHASEASITRTAPRTQSRCLSLTSTLLPCSLYFCAAPTAQRDYGIANQEDGTATFQRYNVAGGSIRIGGSLKIGGDKFKVDQTRLESFCYEIVEEHEDVLSEAIRAAGLAKKARAEEEARVAKAKRKGAEPELLDPWVALELDKPEEGTEPDLKAVRKAYRRLSRVYHPDKNGGDPEAVKKFVRLAQAYETLTGEELTPYGDLYRQVCIDITEECPDEAAVDKIKFFFPRYTNSEKFGNAAGGGLDAAEKERVRRRTEEALAKKAEDPTYESEYLPKEKGSEKKKKKKKKTKKKKKKKAEL